MPLKVAKNEKKKQIKYAMVPLYYENMAIYL